MTVGERIKNRRIELNMTQEELAHKLGYKHKTSINKIESGAQDPPQKKIIAFARALDTTPDILMGWTEDSSEKGTYYTDNETAKIAQEMFDDPDLRALHHMKRNMDPETFKAHMDMMKRMYRLEHPEDDDDFTGC